MSKPDRINIEPTSAIYSQLKGLAAYNAAAKPAYVASGAIHDFLRHNAKLVEKRTLRGLGAPKDHVLMIIHATEYYMPTWPKQAWSAAHRAAYQFLIHYFSHPSTLTTF